MPYGLFGRPLNIYVEAILNSPSGTNLTLESLQDSSKVVARYCKPGHCLVKRNAKGLAERVGRGIGAQWQQVGRTISSSADLQEILQVR